MEDLLTCKLCGETFYPEERTMLLNNEEAHLVELCGEPVKWCRQCIINAVWEWLKENDQVVWSCVACSRTILGNKHDERGICARCAKKLLKHG